MINIECIALHPTAKQHMKQKTNFNRPIRIGFDLDGVLLYNPIRIYRPAVAFVKRHILKRKKTRFFVPTSPFQQWLFTQMHKTSFLIAPGFERIKRLTDAGIIEPYLVTARFAFLKTDLDYWLKKMDADSVFKACYYNAQNEQPHLFKARMIQELNLEMFVEDNWDIVERVNRIVRPSKPDFICWWVSNIMDSGIPYAHKALSLNQAIDGVSFGRYAKRPKLLVASDFFYPHWTGLAQSFMHYMTAIKDQFSVQVRTVKFREDLPNCAQVNQVVVWRSAALLAMSRAKISLRYLADVWRTAAVSDIILVNSPSAHIACIAAIALLRGKRLVVFHNGDLLLPKGVMNRIVETIFDISTHFACLVAQSIGTYTYDYAKHSRILSKHLHKCRAVGVPLLPKQAEPKVIPEQVPHTEAQRAIKLNQLQTVKDLRKTHAHSQLVGFAGRFVEEKGFDILFAAIPLVLKQNPNCKFVFAGEVAMGYERFFEQNESLYRSVRSHVVLLGLLDGEALEEFYRQIDIFVLPSRSDCFALVQAEAALHHVPLVVSDIPGARDLVTTTGCGLLFTSENHLDLAAKITQVLKQPQTYQQKIAVAEYFDYAKRTRSFKQLLTD
jgi:glycosyltransferase involved in cell wall biosynthesis